MCVYVNTYTDDLRVYCAKAQAAGLVKEGAYICVNDRRRVGGYVVSVEVLRRGTRLTVNGVVHRSRLAGEPVIAPVERIECGRNGPRRLSDEEGESIALAERVVVVPLVCCYPTAEAISSLAAVGTVVGRRASFCEATHRACVCAKSITTDRQVLREVRTDETDTCDGRERECVCVCV